MTEDLTFWAEHLETAIENEKLAHFDRAFVLSATNSTQDAARRLCGSNPGAVIIAGRQLSGRGRLGRSWDQRGDLGLAVTFVVAARNFDAPRLSLASGVAVFDAVQSCLPEGSDLLRLRWPNDLVEHGRGRKLAGVLVEVAAPLALIGIGANVHHSAAAWPQELDGAACSIAELGAQVGRIELARRIMINLDRTLSLSAEHLAEEWRRRDGLRGTRAEFMCRGERYCGTVESISPLHEIVMSLDSGKTARLPAAHSTRLNR